MARLATATLEQRFCDPVNTRITNVYKIFPITFSFKYSVSNYGTGLNIDLREVNMYREVSLVIFINFTVLITITHQRPAETRNQKHYPDL